MILSVAKDLLKYMQNITAVILAAGKGVRMKSALPKVLHKLCGKPLIYYIIKEVKKAGIERVVIVIGNQAELVKKTINDLFEGIEFIEQKELLGTGNALVQAKNKLRKEDNILVLPGDAPLITADSFKKLIAAHKQDNSCTLLSAYLAYPQGYGRIIRRDKKIIEIKEERDVSCTERKIKEVNSGVYLFKTKPLFKALSKISPDNKKKEYYLTDVISLFAQQGLKIDSLSISEKEILGINTRKELACAEKIMQTRILENIFKKGASIIDPATTYIAEGVRIGKDSVVYPFTFIEGNVKISKGCQIGPFARIRGDCLIGNNVVIGNFVEIVRCKVRDNSRIKHHSYLGDCLIGRNVNIGAGTIIANYDGKNKNRTVIGENAFIGSGTILVAPVKIGKSAITGAGSVVLKNRDVPDGATVVGVPARLLKRRKSNG